MHKLKITPRRFILTLLFIFFVIYCLITIISQASQFQKNEEYLSEISSQISAEEQRALKLDEETAKIGTDEFIEKKAKEKLGYVKSNEKIFYDKAQ